MGFAPVLTAAVVCGLALTGCATNTGFVPIGDGIFMASKMDYMSWSSGSAKAELFREAAEFCAKEGKGLSPVSSQGRDAAMYSNYASAEIQFRCVSK